MTLGAVATLLCLCAYLPGAAWLCLWERRRGSVVYQRNRESEPAIEVTPRFFLWSRLPLILAPSLTGISLLFALHWILWSVLLYTLSVVGTVAVMVANYRRERHNPRYQQSISANYHVGICACVGLPILVHMGFAWAGSGLCSS